MGILNSAELKKMSQDHDCRILFMPHPNLEGCLPELILPSYVEVASSSDADVQDVIAQSAVFVAVQSDCVADSSVHHLSKGDVCLCRYSVDVAVDDPCD